MDIPESQNQQHIPMDSGGYDKNAVRVRKYFEADRTDSGRKLLVREKRKISKHLEEMNQAQKLINMRNDFTISGISAYAFRVANLPLDVTLQLAGLYDSSLLKRQSFANGRKCADPIIILSKECQEDPLVQRRYRFDQEVVVQIQIQAGARLLLTTNGKFPQPGCQVIYQQNYQRSFSNRCVLRMKVEKEGMIQSNCVSIQLKPNCEDETKNREYTVQKHFTRFDQSNSIQQSDITFPN